MVQAAKSTCNLADPRSMMEALQAPFLLEDLEWRVQRVVKTQKGYKAIVVAYVSNRAIQKRLDELFTPFGWKNEFREWRQKGVLCGISILWEGQWVTKFDGADETDIEGTKGGFSGSQKRAAVEWGIGRYLYSLEEVWVEVKNQGQNYVKSKVKVDGKEEWITGYWDTPVLPDWALPKGKSTERSPTTPSSSPTSGGDRGQGKVVEMPNRRPIVLDCQFVDLRFDVSAEQMNYAEMIFRKDEKENKFYAVGEVFSKVSEMELIQGKLYQIQTEKNEQGLFILKDLQPLEG